MLAVVNGDGDAAYTYCKHLQKGAAKRTSNSINAWPWRSSYASVSSEAFIVEAMPILEPWVVAKAKDMGSAQIV